MSDTKSDTNSRPPDVMVREMPSEMRPRERLEQFGASALSKEELVASLLRMGAQGEAVVSVSKRLLTRFGDLRSLASASLEEIADVRGIGRVKAITIKAAMELGMRLAEEKVDRSEPIRTAEDVWRLYGPRMRQPDKERFCVILLDTKNQVLEFHTVSVGTLNASLVHPREVFREAIRRGCHSIICVHNHPSGDPTPSADDIAVTKDLVKAGEIMKIRVLDHVIIGETRWVSMQETGLI